MIRVATLFGLAGLALATGLLVWQGFGAVLAAFAAAGFGIVWASLFHIVPMALNARAWQVLMPLRLRPDTLFFLRAVWLREAVNGLLPVARIGGEIASARLLIERGNRPPLAVASLVVDMTLALASQFCFAMLGLALLARAGDGSTLLQQIGLGLLAALPILAALALVQRFGFFALLATIVRGVFGDRFQGSSAAQRRSIARCGGSTAAAAPFLPASPGSSLPGWWARARSRWRWNFSARRAASPMR